MTRKQYLHAAIELYLQEPGSPLRATRADWAIAATLFRSHVPIDRLAHAIRLAAIRRGLASDSQNRRAEVRSLAYYRAVLQRLSPDELEIGYVEYVQSAFRNLRKEHGDPGLKPKTAVSPPENCSF